jgi:hypothetical protein
LCSQAPNMANADMANAAREAVAALCKREDLIPCLTCGLF